MRSRKAVLNTIAGLLYEFVAIICSLILPRLILSTFGSSYNGVTNSITQFLGYAALMRAGIGGVAKAALYKPLAENDIVGISGVINATDRFLKRVSLLFAASLVLFATVFPVFVKEDFDWLFTFTLVIILGISTFCQYYFGLTYQFLLHSDQRQCVTSFVQIGTTILNTILCVFLIKLGFGIHVVKLGSAIAFSLNPIIINRYVKKRYKIDKTVLPNFVAIKDRWDCFGLQIANFVNSNTDMFVLTVFTNVREVSVYTVYYMVTNGIRKILLTFVQSLGPAFGNMFAKNEEENIKINLRIFEQITFGLSNAFFATTIVLIMSFVHVYTAGITDVEYIRPVFSYIIVVATLFSVYRIPYQALVEAVGHFKQTRNGAFFEAGLNIVVSLTLVSKFGLVGVAVGTLAATVFRTYQYYIYVSRNLIKRSIWILIKRLILSLLDFVIVITAYNLLFSTTPENYYQWIIQAIPLFVISIMTTFVIEVIFYGGDLKRTFSKLRGVIMRRENI